MYTAPSSSRSSMTCLSIMLKKMLNIVGARTQPCFMLLMMGKDSERLLFNLTWPHWSLRSWISMRRNFAGQPRRSKIIHSPFPLTVSNGLVRSTNSTDIPLFCSLRFSWSFLKTTTLFVVLLLALNSHWVSVRWSSAMVDTNLFRSTRARIFPAMESRVIPR